MVFPFKFLKQCAFPDCNPYVAHKGFKYIGNTALQLADSGLQVEFGYEEAIGFMIGSNIRDKDGISATVRSPMTSVKSNILTAFQVCFAELAISLHNKGSSVLAYLHDLYRKCVVSFFKHG